MGASSRRAMVTAVMAAEEEELRTRGKVKGAKGMV
jgi:hypothetical protein